MCFVPVVVRLYRARKKKLFLSKRQCSMPPTKKIFCVTNEWKINGLDITTVLPDCLSLKQKLLLSFPPCSLGWYLNLDVLRQVMVTFFFFFFFVLIPNSFGPPRPSQPVMATQGLWAKI
jgi:hypothetical protein